MVEFSLRFCGGVFISIFAGMVLNLGSLIQKKAVNQLMTAKRLHLQQESDGFVTQDKYLLYTKIMFTSDYQTGKRFLFSFLFLSSILYFYVSILHTQLIEFYFTLHRLVHAQITVKDLVFSKLWMFGFVSYHRE